ncbi:hypothetical protein [Candidatus Sororendozoicomonas aggregata]|uniref:hypothetical protein n=1 Tax=Candidatus Sororendozoicomonas aggregata TaxID=3073239 RepID=UPI002ED6507B
MSMKSILWARKPVAKKSFALFTLFFCLSILGKAYSSNAVIEVENRIAPGQKYYSEKGYTIKPSGHGRCMYGVYSRASCSVTYGNGSCKLGIHYSSSTKGSCSVKESWQDFEVINNDTGHAVGKFRWRKRIWNDPDLKLTENPGAFMADRTDDNEVSGVLNFWTWLSRSDRTDTF